MTKVASPERVREWINKMCVYLGLSPSYIELESQLAAERTRRKLAEAILNKCDNDTQYTCCGCFSTMLNVNFYRETYPEDKEVKATFRDDWSGGRHALLHGTEDKS